MAQAGDGPVTMFPCAWKGWSRWHCQNGDLLVCLSEPWPGRRAGERSVGDLVLWIKPDFVVWSFIAAGRGMSCCSCSSCGSRCLCSVKIDNGVEWGQWWKISCSFYRAFVCVMFLLYNSFEAVTLNSFSTGLNVCTLVSGLWWNPRSFAPGLLI